MPLEGNIRYRWKTYPSGKKIRLAFRGNKVVETKKKGGTAHKVSSHHSGHSKHRKSDRQIRHEVAKSRA